MNCFIYYYPKLSFQDEMGTIAQIGISSNNSSVRRITGKVIQMVKNCLNTGWLIDPYIKAVIAL